MNMNSVGLQQNFILFVENKTKESNVNRRLCCEKCRFSTKDVDLFERHVAQHDEMTFSCTLCSHVSYSRVESQRHSVSHKGTFPYRCNWCNYGAVRRDYMVKHIQRIHGKTADGSFTTDYALPTTKIEHLSQKGTTELCSDSPRGFVSCSVGKKSSQFLSVSQLKANAPYILAKPVNPMISNQTQLIYSTANQPVTSTACILPITKTQIYSEPATAHAVTKGTQDISNQLRVVDETGKNSGKTTEYVNRLGGKMSFEKNVSPNALSRAHFGKRIPLQKHKRTSTDKTGAQSKTIPNIQAGVPDAHLKTVLSNKLETIAPRTAEVQNVAEAPSGQRPVHSGRNIQLVHQVQRSVPSGGHPSVPVEQVRQGPLSFSYGILDKEKPNWRKTHPNIPEKPPIEKTKSIAQSSVQVELLAPLNQPIQHNRPLTVSCPEEITIPAGCLVELVEVKNVSGTRELELRLVPQLPACPPLAALPRETTAVGTAGRLSFKCRVTTNDDEPANVDHRVCTVQEKSIPAPHVKGSHPKAHSTNITLTIKDEPEVNERVLCSKTSVTQPSGALNAGFPGASRPLVKPASNPSESQKFLHQQTLRTANKLVTTTTDVVAPVLQMQRTDRSSSWSAASRNITAEGVDRDLRTPQALRSKHNAGDVESSYEGLPVISSVFSLCPAPEETWEHIPTTVGTSEKRAGETLTSSDLGSNGNVKNVDDLSVCRHDMKTEEETGPLTKIVKTCQKIMKNKDKPTINECDIKMISEGLVPESMISEGLVPESMISEGLVPETMISEGLVPETMISEGLVPETLADVLEKSSQTCVNEMKDKIPIEQCSILSHSPGTAALVPALDKNFTTHPNEKVNTKLETEDSLPVQRESSPTLAMNPTVTLVRIPSLEFYSVLESTKTVEEKLVEEESITARPVLCCTSNQQNLQGTAIKLVLKRKPSETQNKGLEQDQASLSQFNLNHPHKKRKKAKKKTKKRRSSKIRLDLHQLLQKGKVAKLWLTPLKEDQLIKLPGPNQPVVVLNHPSPLVQMMSAGVQTLKDYKWMASAHGFCPQSRAPPIRQCPSFIMKLKKVQGHRYQVTELVLKGVSEKMIF